MKISRQQHRVKRPMTEWQAAIVLGGMVLGGVLLLTYLLPVALLAAVTFCMVIAPLGMVREARRERCR